MPAHEVHLSPYWLDRTEVTVRAYARCVQLRRCKAPPFAQGGKRFDRPEYPASLVTHEDALAYCRFRGARLPTEAEYERAARGEKARRFPWATSTTRAPPITDAWVGTSPMRATVTQSSRPSARSQRARRRRAFWIWQAMPRNG